MSFEKYIDIGLLSFIKTYQARNNVVSDVG